MKKTIRDLLHRGDKVHYIAPHKGAKPENGILKSFSDDEEYLFVVFHCNGEWHNYEDYTGQRCHISNLYPGWIEKEVQVEEVIS